MQRLSFVGLLLALFFLSRCAFQPDEDNFHVIDSVFTADPVEINLEEAKDTIDVFGLTHFKFEVKGLSQSRAFDVACYVSSTALSAQMSGSNYTFEYNPLYKIGYETLTLEVRQRSGTGSLADKAGAEGILYKATWILAVDTDVPGPVNITSIGPGDGRLKIEWPVYQRKNFKYYQVERLGTYDYTSWQIKDIQSNHFYDSSYVGGKVSYRVRVVSKTDNLIQNVPSVVYEDKVRLQHLKTELSLSQSKIYFPASRYPLNVAGYEVYETGDQKIFATANPLDTSFLYAAKFGSPIDIYVKTIGKPKKTYYTNDSNPFIFSDTLQYVFGETIHTYEKILWAPAQDRFFTFEGSRFYVYSISTGQLQATIDLPASLAAGSIAQDDNYISFFYKSKLYRWDIASLNMETFNLANAATTNEPLLFGAGLLPGDRAMISRGKDPNLMGSMAIYDLRQETILKTYTSVAPFFSIRAWDDQIRAENMTGFISFSIMGDTEISYRTVYFPFDAVYFNPEQAAQLIYGFTNSQLLLGGIYLKDLKTWEEKGKINTPAMSFTSLDVVKHIGVGFDAVGCVVFDYKNQITLWSGPSTTHSVSIYGSYIYSPSGTRLKISE